MDKVFTFECAACGFEDEDADLKRLRFRAQDHAMKHEPHSSARVLVDQGIKEQ